MVYYFRIYKDEKKGYWGEVPELKGCRTEGDTLEEFVKNAQEALSLYLEDNFDLHCDIPEPVKRKGKDYRPIAVDPKTAFPIILRKKRLKMKLTQQTMAEKMNITLRAYQKLEEPGKANPTLETVEKILEHIPIKIDSVFKKAA